MPEKSKITFQAIGTVRVKASDDDVRADDHELESTIEVYPEFKEALDGLNGFSHIFVLSYLHKLRPEQIGPLKVRPRRFLRKGLKLEELPVVGVFALDSPTRPNPIGLTVVKLIKIEENTRLRVVGLDCFDGTPVLDIKPYRGSSMPHEYTIAEWYRGLMQKAGEDV